MFVKKIRCSFQEFNSGKKADIFEKVCRNNNMKHLSALQDIEHRWNSTCRMLARFIELEEGLRAFHREQATEFPLSESEIEAVRNILRALQIVGEASTRLQNAKSTLS